MADQGSRERPSAGFYQLLSNMTSDFLEPARKKTKWKKGKEKFYKVERVISKRSVKGSDEYLIKWEGYSAFSCTWEEEDNLTADLLRTFDRPHIAGARLQENIDNLLMAIMGKLKSKSRGPTVFQFHHDCFRVLFGGKGRHSGDGKSMMLEREHFILCNFPETWDQCLDKNGDGVKIKFPMKIRLTLSWSPRISAVYKGVLVNQPRMPLEKLTVDFVRQPFSVLNI